MEQSHVHLNSMFVNISRGLFRWMKSWWGVTACRKLNGWEQSRRGQWAGRCHIAHLKYMTSYNISHQHSEKYVNSELSSRLRSTVALFRVGLLIEVISVGVCNMFLIKDIACFSPFTATKLPSGFRVVMEISFIVDVYSSLVNLVYYNGWTTKHCLCLKR